MIYNLQHPRLRPALCLTLQVVSLRLPADNVAQFLPQILEGCLLWAEDSKNKFRAKVGMEQETAQWGWVGSLAAGMGELASYVPSGSTPHAAHAGHMHK